MNLSGFTQKKLKVTEFLNKKERNLTHFLKFTKFIISCNNVYQKIKLYKYIDHLNVNLKNILLNNKNSKILIV